MPTIVGILTLISRQNSILGLSYLSLDKAEFLDMFILFEIPCSAELSMGKKVFKIYFYFTAAGVVPCGSRKRKKPPRTSSIVQVILYFSPLRSEDIFQ